jgi:hypothetical protein
MSAGYTFLPWSRQGLANQITGASGARASVQIQLSLDVQQLDGSHASQGVPAVDVQLLGPADIIGLDARTTDQNRGLIIRTEPRDGITNFEPNHLAAIEFYDEDFPWRYTPVAPNPSMTRLNPWLMLVVLKEGVEFEEGANPKDRPLPYITLKNNAQQTAFPPFADLWAWAHVHVNRGLGASDDAVIAADRDAVASSLQSTIDENADLVYSRIVCPRRLEPNTEYHAFLLPAFEGGRLAGLGLDLPQSLSAAWDSNSKEKDNFPFYYRWRFRTGTIGDFEYLVRLLQPKPVDRTVGVREMDVQTPGAGLAGIDRPDLSGVLALGGALRVPRSSLSANDREIAEGQENWAQPSEPFKLSLANFINLADDYYSKPSELANAAAGRSSDPDPVVTPPLYGRWHAQVSRLLTDGRGKALPNTDNWVHELNLDPRYRVSAGFGTRVVQDKQEELMAAAWQQIGDVLEANSRMRRFKFAQQVAVVWHANHFQPIAATNASRALLLTAPVHARVMTTDGGAKMTMRSKVSASAIPSALVCSTMRRLTRPRSRIMRALPFDRHVRPDNLLERVNRREVLPAPARVTPQGLVTVGTVASVGLPTGLPKWAIDLLRKAHWLVYVPLLLAVILALLLWLLGFGPAVAGVAAAIGLATTAWLTTSLHKIQRADALLEGQQTPEAVDRMPPSPNFTFTAPGAASASITLSATGNDSAEATRFKSALKDLDRLVQAGIAADRVGENGPARKPLDLAGEVGTILRAIDPAVTIPRRAAALITVPARIAAELPEQFSEAMAYPVFDIPMYRPLADISAELLIPNINKIENNSLTLLETNQKFIEAYMVGLNHEFARELLWREYPTDQRGSYFRQFWDVSSLLADKPKDGNEATLRESLRDIAPLHLWSRTSKLGDHDARKRPSNNEEEIVLVIRGELLKRYPNAVIYALAAQWQRKANGYIDTTKPRTLVDVDPDAKQAPSRDVLRTPLYMSKVEPEIFFLGFDLTISAALGGTGEKPNDPPGWFFVIKEREGEPRFGFEETSGGSLSVWSDLGWDKVPLKGTAVKFIDPNATVSLTAPSVSVSSDEQRQTAEDGQVYWNNDPRWNNDGSAAELAYILYQPPMMVAIHAREMLPTK